METIKSKIKGMLTPVANKNSFNVRGQNLNVEEWEIRPGGMLVQKRNVNPIQNSAVVSTIKVRVKYGSSLHEIRISSQTNFGELKKVLAERTGVHHQDQKLIYKKKERDSKEYLDVARVKDGSKLVLIEDVTSREKRFLEMLKSARIEKTSQFIQQISLQVDNLVHKVTSLEAKTSRGGNVVETDVDKLTEILMSKLVALDGIAAEGDLKLQKGMQEKRVQKCIETLDMLKLNSYKTYSSKGKFTLQQQENSTGQMPAPMPRQNVEPGQKNLTVQMPIQQPIRHSESVVVTAKWVTFD